jgi:hypothetical protein
MEQENQGKNQSLAQMELSMPRFDEEATVLHARQVVPLIEVKRQARWRRGLLALVGLITLLGGAIYGRLAYLPPVEKETQNTILTISGHLPHDAAPPGAASGFSGENSVSTPTAHPDVQEFDREPPNPLGRRSPDLKVTSNTDRNRYGQNDVRLGDGRRHDRPRDRQNLREGGEVGRQKARNSDDLFRIQEIFEGRQTARPN